MEELPKNSLRKILKKDLRRMAVEKLNQQEETSRSSAGIE